MTGQSAEGREDNRRAHKRHRFELEIDITSDHNFYSGITRDLSAGGVFVATHLEKPVGTLVDLALKLPKNDTPLRFVGEVRWVRSYNEQSDAPPGFGVRFVLLEPGARAAIERFLTEREPELFDD